MHQTLRTSVQATGLAAKVVLPEIATHLFAPGTFADSQENSTATYVLFSARRRRMCYIPHSFVAPSDAPVV